jgi:TolA-binding protein
MFESILERYPRTPSAGMAQYHVGVIHDYCFKETSQARAAFEAFLSRYPMADPRWRAKAEARLRALGVPAGK